MSNSEGANTKKGVNWKKSKKRWKEKTPMRKRWKKKTLMRKRWRKKKSLIKSEEVRKVRKGRRSSFDFDFFDS